MAINYRPKSAPPVKLPNNAPKGDNREGRLTAIKTDRGEFRFKANKKEEV